jgi:hypothetical protein
MIPAAAILGWEWLNSLLPPVLKKIAESFRDWGRDCWCPPGVNDALVKAIAQEASDVGERGVAPRTRRRLHRFRLSKAASFLLRRGSVRLRAGSAPRITLGPQ